MAISNDQQAQMVNTAGFSYESLGQVLSQQLEQAMGKQQNVVGQGPEVAKDIDAIRSMDNRVPGQAPSTRIAAANSLGQSYVEAASSNNVIDIITKMMNLKNQEESSAYQRSQLEISQQQAQLELLKTQKETGWTIDPITQQPRPMTDEEKEQMQLEGLDETTAAYLEMFQNGAMKRVNEIPIADRGMVVQALAAAGVDPEEIAKRKEGGDVEGVIRSLYDLYATNNDLSLGRAGGAWATLQGVIGKNPPAKKYKDLKNGVLSAIRSFVGEKGIMTEPDAQRIASLLPSVTDNDAEAIIAWEQINDLFKAKYGFDVIPELSASVNNTGIPEGTVLMESPEGNQVPIYINEKEQALQNGWKEIK